jgi:hypothetical protein
LELAVVKLPFVLGRGFESLHLDDQWVVILTGVDLGQLSDLEFDEIDYEVLLREIGLLSYWYLELMLKVVGLVHDLNATIIWSNDYFAVISCGVEVCLAHWKI